MNLDRPLELNFSECDKLYTDPDSSTDRIKIDGESIGPITDQVELLKKELEVKNKYIDAQKLELIEQKTINRETDKRLINAGIQLEELNAQNAKLRRRSLERQAQVNELAEINRHLKLEQRRLIDRQTLLESELKKTEAQVLTIRGLLTSAEV